MQHATRARTCRMPHATATCYALYEYVLFVSTAAFSATQTMAIKEEQGSSVCLVLKGGGWVTMEWPFAFVVLDMLGNSMNGVCTFCSWEGLLCTAFACGMWYAVGRCVAFH